MKFAGPDCGMFVFGRDILAKNPAACLTFFYKVSPKDSKDIVFEANLWPKDLPKNTGIMADHHRYDIAKFYTQSPYFPTQILHHLACEGLSDTVEFRRLARKYLRRAKQHNLKTIFFPESIFADTKTKKILQHLAGTQLKIKTLEIPDTYHTPHTTAPRSITIYHDLEDVTFLKARAEALLGTKIREADLKTLN